MSSPNVLSARLLSRLVDPESHRPLVASDEGLASTAKLYPVVNSIPRFTFYNDEAQEQTSSSFSFKWSRSESFGSASSMDVYGAWISRKYGFADPKALREYLSRAEWLLDAGCGAGYTASIYLDEWWRENARGNWVGVDISDAVDVARQSIGLSERIHLVQADITKTPFVENCFDLIFSEGVLHHTPSTQGALNSLIPLLKPGGEFFFYVYKKKGPLREMADDYLREMISALPHEEAWNQLIPLTKLGQALSAMQTVVEVPEDIPYLGIKAGSADIQRFLYYNFLKLFWNDSYTFEENVHVNFDWYHPKYAHRQTEQEVRDWCSQGNLKVEWIHSDESGIAVRARRL